MDPEFTATELIANALEPPFVTVMVALLEAPTFVLGNETLLGLNVGMDGKTAFSIAITWPPSRMYSLVGVVGLSPWANVSGITVSKRDKV